MFIDATPLSVYAILESLEGMDEFFDPRRWFSGIRGLSRDRAFQSSRNSPPSWTKF